MSWPLFDLMKASPDPAANALDLFLGYATGKNLELYPAQEEALLELYSGKNVILNTPTGSGKSLVAAAVHFHSLARGHRSIYTCPIKALVNEKFLSLCREFGPAQVGMITGDATVNPDAPIICCTAEILSNLALRLGEETPFQDIIVDEFHYYSDRDRGVAWQIPLLILRKSRFLLMSATLGDTSFFEKSLTELNGLETVLVRGTDRPVPLEFEYSERPLHAKISELIERGRAPVYLVNFTQRECAEDAQMLLSTDFCTKDEKKKIADFLSSVDFGSPYGKDLQRILRHGIGLHHAGLLPRYRVLVEKLAQQGMLKVICGTDTLGVGVNVPIRTVLFTKLSKYDGQKSGLLNVRDFQQISGRAGRRGFDDRGTVVIQAPEHMIENAEMERKAAGDPKKAKKLVRKKPPEKFVGWNKDTVTKLVEGKPEPLVSRFAVSHAMILEVLSRPGTRNCNALRDLIRRSHESPTQKRHHAKVAFRLFRSLHERKIIELNPLRVNVDLQEDFSLNHALSLYLIDTIALLDPEDPNYALDVLTLAESILENPELILRRQVDRLKTIRMSEMKAAGMEYDERMEELEKIEHPKPRREFIYDTFNRFAADHPWVGQENVRPKSVAREMFETFQSFHDYIRDYDLQRVEGLLLRYLSEVYKVLVQTVPATTQTDEIISMIQYFSDILKDIDSSLIEEWEQMNSPAAAAARVAARQEKAALADAARREEEEKKRQKREREIAVRNEVFRVLRALANRDFATAATHLGVTPEEAEAQMAPFFEQHARLVLDQDARSARNSRIIEEGPEQWQVTQNLIDAEGVTGWALEASATRTSEGRVSLRLTRIGESA